MGSEEGEDEPDTIIHTHILHVYTVSITYMNRYSFIINYNMRTKGSHC